MIAISIDDGSYKDFEVIEICHKLNIPITFYISAGHLEGKHKWKQYYEGRSFTEIRNSYLRYGNVEIGCHGWQHADMSKLNNMNVKTWVHESVEAKAFLEDFFGVEIKAYSFPYGQTSPGFAMFLTECQIFDSLRLYRIHHDIEIKSPILWKPLTFIPHLEDLQYPVDKHYAGHTHEFLDNLPEIVNFVREAKTNGHKFVKVSDYYNGRVPF